MHVSSSGAELNRTAIFGLFIGFGESGRESGGESGGSPEGVRLNKCDAISDINKCNLKIAIL